MVVKHYNNQRNSYLHFGIECVLRLLRGNQSCIGNFLFKALIECIPELENH